IVFPMRPTVSPARPSVSPPRFPSNPASPPHRPVCLSSASAPPVKGVLRPVKHGRNTKIQENESFRQEKHETQYLQRFTWKQSQQT
ncbi:hypothetical protein VXL34_03070, partial [Phaeobacter sp. JH20_13]|uniref:hypothetical protein n=1 Tax=Phaeobacter sp. JH20_13 TaxID=3112472 RepID=UPI003A87E38A